MSFEYKLCCTRFFCHANKSQNEKLFYHIAAACAPCMCCDLQQANKRILRLFTQTFELLKKQNHFSVRLDFNITLQQQRTNKVLSKYFGDIKFSFRQQTDNVFFSCNFMEMLEYCTIFMV